MSKNPNANMINIEEDDSVFHRPSRETWKVKRVNYDVYPPQLYWYGYPPGCAKLSDCLLVRKAVTVNQRGE